MKNNNLPDFIVNGKCEKDEQGICNIGYACDGCPYNKDNKIICYCCKKEKECIKIDDKNVCKTCNHLQKKKRTK